MLAHGVEVFGVSSGEPPVGVEQLCNKCLEVFSLIWDQEGTNAQLQDVHYPFSHIQIYGDTLVCRLCACFARSINCRGMIDPHNTTYLQVNRSSTRPSTGEIMLTWRNAEGSIRTSILHIARGGQSNFLLLHIT